MSETHVVYICDRKQCENCSYPLCEHTTDISHAINFEDLGDGCYAEKKELTEHEQLRRAWQKFKDDLCETSLIKFCQKIVDKLDELLTKRS